MNHKELRESNIQVLQKIIHLLDIHQPQEALLLIEQTTFAAEFDLMKRQIEAEILAKLQEHHRAECAYLAIMRDHPENTDTQFALSQLYHQSSRFNQALELLEAILDSEPEHYMAWNNKGNVLRGLKKDREALTCYEKALEISPNYLVSLTNCCVTCACLGQFEKALVAGNKAIELYPNNSDSYALVFDIYQKMDNSSEASELLERALEQCGETERLLQLRAAG